LIFWVAASGSAVVGYQSFVEPEGGGSIILRKVSIQPPHYTTQQFRKPRVLYSPYLKPQVLQNITCFV